MLDFCLVALRKSRNPPGPQISHIWNYGARLSLWVWFPHVIIFLKAEMIQREVSLHVCSHFLSYMNYQQHAVFWELILIQLAPMLLFPKWHYWYKWQSLMIAQADIFWIVSISIFFEVVETVSSFPGPSTARGGQVIQLWQWNVNNSLVEVPGETFLSFLCFSLLFYCCFKHSHNDAWRWSHHLVSCWATEPTSSALFPDCLLYQTNQQTNKQNLTLL